MARFRRNLPQLSGELFLTDGGIETTLIFHEGLELPEFAAFDLLRTSEGYQALRDYFDGYATLATRKGAGLILESATWRANPDWIEKIGYQPRAIEKVNQQAIALLAHVREAHETERTTMIISGCIGPRDDGYDPNNFMAAEEAQVYHSTQIEVLCDTDADMVTAITMTYEEEAVGVTRAARQMDMPVAISFTVETDGCLPTGQSLGDAIARVDELTEGYPAYYMINCAHPSHFRHTLREATDWTDRIRGVRANASKRSHAELDEAEELDEGNPRELGDDFRDLKALLGNMNVLGGCCGTDHRHIEAIHEACRPLF